jgi:hypothetical protein
MPLKMAFVAGKINKKGEPIYQRDSRLDTSLEIPRTMSGNAPYILWPKSS